MSITRATRRIAAPIDRVFSAIATPENFLKTNPSKIVAIDFLTEQREGAGTRFSETRLMNGKPNVTELEIAEWVAGERVRMVTPELHGTVWDTLFTVAEVGGQTELTLQMEARTTRWTARAMNRLIRGMLQRAVEGDMDAVKQHCEHGAPRGPEASSDVSVGGRRSAQRTLKGPRERAALRSCPAVEDPRRGRRVAAVHRDRPVPRG